MTQEPKQTHDDAQHNAAKDNSENCDCEKNEACCANPDAIVEEYKGRAMRAQADYQNLQREIEQKRSQWIAMSEIQVLEAFVPVFDNFVKAFNHKEQLAALTDAKWQGWVDGIGFIKKQFEDKLTEFGIERIKTVGEVFNPVFHEAVGEQDGEGTQSNVILTEIDCGYKKGDIIIRPAKVIIAK